MFFRNVTPHINNFFKQSQLFTAGALAFSHGTNDAQKTIGIITLSLIIGGELSDFDGTVLGCVGQRGDDVCRYGVRWVASYLYPGRQVL